MYVHSTKMEISTEADPVNAYKRVNPNGQGELTYDEMYKMLDLYTNNCSLRKDLLAFSQETKAISLESK